MDKDLDVLFQLNNVIMDAPTDVIHTQDGARLYVQVQLLDYSGSVGVGFVEEAVPSIFRLESKEEVESSFKERTLSVDQRRMNCRGSLRSSQRPDGQAQLLIGAIVPTERGLMPSSTAKGLCHFVSTIGPHGHGVVCTEASKVQHSALLGLCVTTSTGALRPVKLACLLLKGTRPSKLDKVEQGGAAAEAYMVRSSQAQCLLSGSEDRMEEELVGYCAVTDLLEYNLGLETAAVYVSAVTSSSDTREFVVDRMEKVPSDLVHAVRESMLVESAMALSEPQVDNKRSVEELVTPESTKRCRSIERYPTE